MTLDELSAWELAGAVRGGRLGAEEVARHQLERIQALNARLHAFLSVHREEALQQARELDRRISAGEDPGPLAGVPIALKDNLCTRDLATTCGSRMLENFRPPYEATVVRRLREAGATVLGKTNLDEFAMGSSTENSAFGPTRNPWDTDRVPGGSSGGSAAAVAAGMVPVALGSDTGGSIRQPAALCGVTGLKPTYGRVSRYGLVAFGSSLDQIGPLARDARDCALLLSVLAGHDPQDSTSHPDTFPDYVAELSPECRDVSLGVPRSFLEGLAPGMARSFEAACQALEGLGARLVPVDLPRLSYALPAYYIVAPAEASSNLARYDGVRYGYRAPDAPDVLTMFKRTRARGFGPEVKRRIMLGTYALSRGYYDAYYLKAQQVRNLLSQDFAAAFEQVDFILMPATPEPAFRIGEKSDPLAMYLSDVYTVALNLVGLPGLVVPMAPVDGLPAGLQIVARAWDEARLLSLGHAFQQVTEFHRARPPVTVAR
ncbi:MAG: Asp-tRNA(Asn)/Glu-tRNA(Gln) amidotransferase subunit GatA [Candidatus Eremiobacterota bacterium]